MNNATTGDFGIRDVNGNASPFKVEPGAPANFMTIKSTGTVEILGNQVHPDYVFEPSYELESIKDHAEYMFANKHLPAVGRGIYDDATGRPIISLGQRSTGVLEELEKAHIYIVQLNETIDRQVEMNRSLLDQIKNFENRLDKLESMEVN